MLTHPLFRSRVGAVAAATVGGSRSMLGHWMGGISAAPAAADTPGIRSMLRHWMGGVSATPAAAVVATPATPLGRRTEDRHWAYGEEDWRHLGKAVIEDENEMVEILAIVTRML